MKRTILSVMLCGCALWGQKQSTPVSLSYSLPANQLNAAPYAQTGSGAPTAVACNSAGLDRYYDTAASRWYECAAPGAPGTWVEMISATGAYANPAFISSLAWSKITGAPAFATYPGAGVPNSTGTSWGSSYSLVTSLGNPGTNTNIPSEAAVRAAIGAAGTVSSVGLTMPAWLAVSGSPVTTSGTIAVSAASGQASHQFIGTCGAATSVAPCTPTLGDLPATLVNTGGSYANPAWLSLTYTGDVLTSGYSLAVTKIGGVAIPTSGLLKGAAGPSVVAAAVGTDYAPATTGSAILKGNGSGGFASAAAGTDYQAPLGYTAENVANKDVNSGYVGRDSSGNSTIPGSATASEFDTNDSTHTGLAVLKPGSCTSTGGAGFLKSLPPAGSYGICLDASNSNCPVLVDSTGATSLIYPGCGGTTAAAPTFDNGTNTYANSVSVSVSDVTPSATICYTTDGSDPAASTPGTCTHGTAYSTSITITATGTVLKALGTKSGYTNSSITSATYTLQVGAITASPTAPYTGASTSVSLSTATTSAAIHYRTDGTSAGCGDTTYSTSISVASTETITAIGCKASYVNSAAFSGTYTISSTVATPTDSPGAGTYTTSASVTLNDATTGATICYRTDGSAPTAATPGTCDAGSTTYSGPFSVTATVTVKAIGTKSGNTNSSVLSSIYTIQAATPTDSPGQGSYSPSVAVTLTSSTPGTVICYRLDGTNPAATTPGACDAGSLTYSGAFTLSSTTTVKALSTEAGITNSGILSSTYTVTSGGISVVTGLHGYLASTGTSVSSSTTINLRTHDQVILAATWNYVTSCATPTITWTDTAGNTISPVGSRVVNAWNNSLCIAMFQIQDATANASDTITFTSSVSQSYMAFSGVQVRGTSNSTADATATCDSNTAGNNCLGVNSSAIGSSSNVTTSVAASFAVSAIAPYSGGTITPTASGCFGTTGIVPANAAATPISLQYSILSSIATGTCAFDTSLASSKALVLGVFH